MTVARGIVRVGLSTSSAGTVADSTPMNDHSVSAATAVIAPYALSPLGLKPPKLEPCMKNNPARASASSGTNFSTVVTPCTMPPWRTPRMLTNVSSQIAAMATTAANTRLSFRASNAVK
jgi:hypothetical protein